ncbi:MAG: hypothetical protein KC502_10315 [Myxococcales bacterium]|nr:hypothetical protein [Myxococcales bacterium]
MIIIGGGRVGQALETRAAMRGVPCALIRRKTGWEALTADGSGPILVATRNDDLAAVLEKVPAARREDLVFLQNGMLRSWLADNGLTGATRGLLFFAVAKRGDDLTPGSESPFSGPRASAVVRWLQRLDVPAIAVADQQFREVELEKLIWNSAFGLLCERYGAPVGTIVARHRDELQDLVDEMNRVGGAHLGVSLELAPLVERLCGFSLGIADYKGAVKEWPWRNGWFVQEALQRGIQTPVHGGLLAATGHG